MYTQEAGVEIFFPGTVSWCQHSKKEKGKKKKKDVKFQQSTLISFPFPQYIIFFGFMYFKNYFV